MTDDAPTDNPLVDRKKLPTAAARRMLEKAASYPVSDSLPAPRSLHLIWGAPAPRSEAE